MDGSDMSTESELSNWDVIGICYTTIRATLTGTGRHVVVNARTQEDDLHTAILQVCDSAELITEDNALAKVRARYNALRKGNRIEQQKTIEYNNNGMDLQTEED